MCGSSRRSSFIDIFEPVNGVGNHIQSDQTKKNHIDGLRIYIHFSNGHLFHSATSKNICFSSRIFIQRMTCFETVFAHKSVQFILHSRVFAMWNSLTAALLIEKETKIKKKEKSKEHLNIKTKVANVKLNVFFF